jgi:hypothetical protein
LKRALATQITVATRGLKCRRMARWITETAGNRRALLAGFAIAEVRKHGAEVYALIVFGRHNLQIGSRM